MISKSSGEGEELASMMLLAKVVEMKGSIFLLPLLSSSFAFNLS